MRRLAAVAVLFAFLAQGAAAAGRVFDVSLPHAVRAGDSVVLRVRAGVLRRGMEIDVYDARGGLIGTVSPFAIRGHREAGTYTFALSGDALQGKRIKVRLVLRSFGLPPRAPTKQEVRSVTAALTR